MIPGRDYIGVGVGAMVFNHTGQIFMAQRGPLARNEQDAWEFPGGAVGLGERMTDSVRREFREEHGMEIAIERPLGAFDHFIPSDREHWVSITYIASHISGYPEINEPGKCSKIGWFSITALPRPLSLITQSNLHEYRRCMH